MAKRKNFPLRIDPKLYDALEAWANDEFRSVNSHMEFLLRESLKKAGRLPKLQERNKEED
ncbi:Arc family DNA-binding protein [Ornithinibacillus xuwenensis]|uniref:Arc family DNA-binding protein n=1 Tax=Ornithinibacillus xuwenensis TaxID=3144668 RepID=A0ABU9XLN2_9BACI